MMLFYYMVPLAAWAVFIYHMHHSGGRPTTYVWWAFMTGLGTFELGKGIAMTIGAPAPVLIALSIGVFAAGSVLIVQARRVWNPTSTLSPAVGR